MNFAKLIKSGYCITIEPDGIENKGFSHATFFYIAPFYWTSSAAGTIPRSDLSERKINKHIKTMIEECFKITIMKNAANPELMQTISKIKRGVKIEYQPKVYA